VAKNFQIGTLNPAYGRGVHEMTDVDLVEPEQILAALRTSFTSPHYRPPMLPAVSVQVHALTRRADSTLNDVVDLIETDAMLAADVLRRAQSPLYAGRSSPRTVRDAAMRLGTKGLGELVMEVALSSRVFRVKGLEPTMAALQKHTVAAAHCARSFAAASRVCDPDVAFLCGLLHDVGVVAGLHVLADLRRGKPIDLELVVGPLRQCADEAGALIVTLWGLPAFVRQSIERHHSPLGFDADAARLDPAAACVLLGDAMCSRLGMSTPLGGIDLDLHSNAAVLATLRGIGLTVDQFTNLERRMGELLCE